MMLTSLTTMNNKARYFFIITVSLLISLELLVSTLLENRSLTKEIKADKDIFISVVRLPDLAVSTESYFIRHRSLCNMQDIFLDAPEHIEYFPSTFSTNFSKVKENVK